MIDLSKQAIEALKTGPGFDEDQFLDTLDNLPEHRLMQLGVVPRVLLARYIRDLQTQLQNYKTSIKGNNTNLNNIPEPDRKHEFYAVPLVPPRWVVIQRTFALSKTGDGDRYEWWEELTHEAIAECPSQHDAEMIVESLLSFKSMVGRGAHQKTRNLQQP